MQNTLILFICIFTLVGCTNDVEVFVSQGSENWSESQEGVPDLPRCRWKEYLKGSDTLIYISNYHENGKLKSKVVMKNEGLWQIESVLDSLGNNLNFGTFKNGNGYVKVFAVNSGYPEREGKYFDGNKEGWWKNYHYTGTIMDSTLYKGGRNISSVQGTSALDILLGPPGAYKNNLYK